MNLPPTRALPPAFHFSVSAFQRFSFFTIPSSPAFLSGFKFQLSSILPLSPPSVPISAFQRFPVPLSPHASLFPSMFSVQCSMLLPLGAMSSPGFRLSVPMLYFVFDVD